MKRLWGRDGRWWGMVGVLTTTLVLVTAGESQAQRSGGARGGSVYYNRGYGVPGWSGGYAADYATYAAPVTLTAPATTFAAPTPAVSTNQSFYPPDETAPGQGTPIMIQVVLPAADGQVWFNNAPTKQTGTVRYFATPPLASGKAYTYQIRATWMVNGQPVSQTRDITVEWGKPSVVNFQQ
jgi:uncharacterized protein (TIGR03000 family)